jgi:superfamily I DNA/RNA helicase
MSALSEAIAELASNDRQWDAFRADGHCAVLAPPGSGKTKLLTTKLADALAGDTVPRPRGAACITMTNDAALQLRARLRGLGVARRPNLFTGTVHAFALSRIIGPFAAAAGNERLASSRLASERELREAFDAAFARTEFRPNQRGEVKTTTDKARQRLDLTGNRLLGGQPIADMAVLLQKELAARGLFDFHDLVRFAVELVEQHEWIGRALAASFPRIYVDEYQDLAPGLDRIVRGIALRSDLDTVLFAVGDPDQAIYAFAGAHPRLLNDLAREPEVQTVTLERNYRCGQAIIDVSLRALGQTRAIHGEHDGGSVRLHTATGGVTGQAAVAVALVTGAIGHGIAPEQIAVISPWGSDRDLCAAALRDAGVSVFARTDRDWATTPLTMLLEAIASWTSRRAAAGIELHELVDQLRAIAPDAREHMALRAAVAAILHTPARAPARELVEAIANVVLRRHIADPGAGEDARELARMRAALADGGKQQEMTVAGLGARARAPGHVMGATIHAAKGLEFDVVILAGADEVGLPGFNANDEQHAEGRRKFYVSITRARREVHLIHTDIRISRKGNPYDPCPCPFIAELGL